MYLFARSARLGPGNPAEQAAWAIGITEKVNQISELDVSLWSRVFSPGLGTLVWTAIVEELATLEATDAKLLADSGYLSLVEQGAKYSSGEAIDDGLLQLVHADEDAANTQPQYASVVQGVIAPGNTVQAIAFGVEIAQAAKKVTGRPTSFGVASTGPYGGVEWISLYDSIEQLQKADADVAADASFAELVDKQAAKLYLPGVTTQTVFRKII
jgi:hypothetical protein